MTTPLQAAIDRATVYVLRRDGTIESAPMLTRTDWDGATEAQITRSLEAAGIDPRHNDRQYPGGGGNVIVRSEVRGEPQEGYGLAAQEGCLHTWYPGGLGSDRAAYERAGMYYGSPLDGSHSPTIERMRAAEPVRVSVDHENNADEFWSAMQDRFPEISRRFMLDDETEIDRGTWDEIQRLPGFADGPSFAKYALFVVEDSVDA